MIKKVCGILLILFYCQRVLASAEAAFAKIKPLVFQVKTSASATLEKSSYGTGFVVDKSGLLVTNYHVVADALWKPEKLKIFVVINGENVEAEIEKVDFINDLAVIKVPQTFSDRIRFPSKPPVQGEEIFSLGLPQDIEWTVVAGIHNGVVKRGPFESIHMSSPINSGMSGGPTVNRKNELVAVNASGYLFSQQISFGVPYQKVVKLLESKVPAAESKEETYKLQLQEQLEALQKDMTAEILESLNKKKKVGHVTWPDFSKYVKCWGTSTEDEKKARFLYEVENCNLEGRVPLTDSTYTGSFSFDVGVYTNKDLNSMAWLAFRADSWNKGLASVVPMFNKESKINFAPVKCERSRVDTKDHPVTVSLCAQKILPLKNLYDGYLTLMKPMGKDVFVRSNVALSGFTQENIKLIVKSFLEQTFQGEK